MRYLLTFWALPMGLFWGWYFLSYNDINFGTVFFSRAVHNFAFDFYGSILGIDPDVIPGMVARACIVDTALIFGIYAFYRRRDIMAWWRARQAEAAAPEAGRAPPAE